jgi:hypothetical protein
MNDKSQEQQDTASVAVEIGYYTGDGEVSVKTIIGTEDVALVERDGTLSVWDGDSIIAVFAKGAWAYAGKVSRVGRII